MSFTEKYFEISKNIQNATKQLLIYKFLSNVIYELRINYFTKPINRFLLEICKYLADI